VERADAEAPHLGEHGAVASTLHSAGEPIRNRRETVPVAPNMPDYEAASQTCRNGSVPGGESASA
jgi:hypothetical protein